MRFAAFFLITPLACATTFGCAARAETIVCQRCVSGICDYSSTNGQCKFANGLDKCTTVPIRVCLKHPTPNDSGWIKDWDDTDWAVQWPPREFDDRDDGSSTSPKSAPISAVHAGHTSLPRRVLPLGGERLSVNDYRVWRAMSWEQRRAQTPDDFAGVVGLPKSHANGERALPNADGKPPA